MFYINDFQTAEEQAFFCPGAFDFIPQNPANPIASCAIGAVPGFGTGGAGIGYDADMPDYAGGSPGAGIGYDADMPDYAGGSPGAGVGYDVDMTDPVGTGFDVDQPDFAVAPGPYPVPGADPSTECSVGQSAVRVVSAASGVVVREICVKKSRRNSVGKSCIDQLVSCFLYPVNPKAHDLSCHSIYLRCTLSSFSQDIYNINFNRI